MQTGVAVLLIVRVVFDKHSQLVFEPHPKIPTESPVQVLRAAELPGLLVALGLDNPEDHGLQLFQVGIPDGKVDAEAVP
jgi:hypothetical protein